MVNTPLFLAYANNHQKYWAGGSLKGSASVSDDEAIVRGFMWMHSRHMQQSLGLVSLPPDEAIPRLRQFDRETRGDTSRARD